MPKQGGLVTHPKQEEFLLVYVFCGTNDTIPEKHNSSEWCKFGLIQKDAIESIFATAFATKYGTGANQLWRQNRPTGDIARECRGLFSRGFNTKIKANPSRLYPKLFTKIRKAGFLTGTVLVKDSIGYTLYHIDKHRIRVIAEEKVT